MCTYSRSHAHLTLSNQTSCARLRYLDGNVAVACLTHETIAHTKQHCLSVTCPAQDSHLLNVRQTLSGIPTYPSSPVQQAHRSKQCDVHPHGPKLRSLALATHRVHKRAREGVQSRHVSSLTTKRLAKRKPVNVPEGSRGGWSTNNVKGARELQVILLRGRVTDTGLLCIWAMTAYFCVQMLSPML